MKKRNQLLRQLLILFLVIVVLHATMRRVKESFEDGAEPTWCILLTSCAKRPTDSQEEAERRITSHTNVIRSWLEKTNLPIFIVDSSAYPYDEFKDTRLKVIAFDMKGNNMGSSTKSEAKSVLHAIESSDIQPYTHILKVTCKYFLTDIEKRLTEQSPNCDIYLQYSHTSTGQNTELIGFKKSVGKKLFERIFDSGMIVETYLGSHINKDPDNHYSICRFPPFENIFKYERGNGSVLTRL
jgi:hypothetical protein